VPPRPDYVPDEPTEMLEPNSINAVGSQRRTFSHAELTAEVPVRKLSPSAIDGIFAAQRGNR
jgi:hypothetical protein